MKWKLLLFSFHSFHTKFFGQSFLCLEMCLISVYKRSIVIYEHIHQMDSITFRWLYFNASPAKGSWKVSFDSTQYLCAISSMRGTGTCHELLITYHNSLIFWGSFLFLTETPKLVVIRRKSRDHIKDS